jgi:hypothetical protein
MDKDDLVRYLMWIAFFALVLSGVILMLKKIGII